MGSRNFRKKSMRAVTNQPPDDSEEEYQPLYAQNAGVSQYAGLEISSQSESEHVSERSEEDLQDNAYARPTGAINKKKSKKKGKGKARSADNEMDEVERSVQEVNAIMGAPPPAPVQPVNQALEILTLDLKHLNVANELRKIFGPEDHNRRSRGAPHRAFLLRRVLIHPNKETPIYEYKNSGWSMIKYKDIADRKYFVFNHSDEYQEMHRKFLQKYVLARGSGDLLLSFDEVKATMHVEALLEISDRLFRIEENGIGNEIIENVVTFLQYVAHPLFVLTQNNIRLDYKFIENRPFHVAMLKYIYLLSNKACHRTALEIAKLLLLLDPNDPLALVSLIDILALRCREHEWLIDAVRYFDRQREATLLFNIKYSYSLAHFHVALKNKLDFTEADNLIREAILAFPSVFIKILECCHVTNPVLTEHVIFKPDPPASWSAGGAEVFYMYAKMTSPRWNEPAVMSWLLKNAVELCENYDNDPGVRESADDWSISRHSLFQVWPPEYLRHLSVFAPMSKLVIEVPMTSFKEPTCAWDPLFSEAINRYSYSYKYENPNLSNYGHGGPVFRFFHSMIPSYFEPPVDD